MKHYLTHGSGYDYGSGSGSGSGFVKQNTQLIQRVTLDLETQLMVSAVNPVFN